MTVKELSLNDFKKDCTEYHVLEKTLSPKRKAIEEDLEIVTEEIISKSRCGSCLSHDRIEDLSIVEAGIYYQEYYEKLLKLRSKLEKAKGEYVLIHDIGYQMFLNLAYSGHKVHSPFKIAAIGKIGNDPLQAGFEEETDDSHFYLKLMFENGAYVRECEVDDEEDERLFSKVMRLIPSHEGTRVYREKVDSLRYVRSREDYEKSYSNIRALYLNGQGSNESKKPYWKIAPGRFKSHNVVIDNRPFVEVRDHKDNIQFAIHIGNEEIMKRTGINLNENDTLDKLFKKLQSSKKDQKGKSLIL
jgi:hypothetical protein